MADKPIRVKAYGKVVNFPAGTATEDIEAALAEHEHVLNPDYEKPSGFSGLLGSLPRGTRGTGRMLSAGTDVFRGELQGVDRTASSASLAAQRETPVEQTRLQEDLADINREQGVGAQIGETLTAAGRNPMGTGQMIVEQLPNTAVTLGGGYAGFKAGALAGAPFGPAGAAIGGTIGFLGGMFLGNTLIEAGSKGIQKASDKDGFTAQDKDETIREAAIKGAVLTGVDAATLKLGSMVMKRLGRTAIGEGAKAEAKVLMDAGVDVTSISAMNTALKGSPELYKAARLAGEKAAVNALSRSKKASIAGAGMSLETVGEGIGEYAGEYAATGKGDVVDATIEALSSSAMSAAETAYNFNKLNLGNDMSLEGISRANLTDKSTLAGQKAKTTNDQQQEQDLADIGAAGSVEEAITAASKTASRPSVTTNDVLRSDDPTLTDIENLTGLKPTDAIDTALDEIDNQIFNQSLELTGNANQKAEQATTTQTSVLDSKAGGIGGTGATEIVLPDSTTLQAKWTVVDADSVKATIKEGVNQPRDRTRAASDLQIKGIANNPDYRRLSDSVLLDTGSPTLSHDGLIVGGNGRFEAINKSYEQGSSTNYRESLIRDAISKGLDTTLVSGMKKPVLVRQITEPFDTRKLAIASNSGANMAYSGLELAKIDASRMGGIEDLDITEGGDIALTGSNISKIRNSLVDYNTSEIAQMIGSDGTLSQDGVKRVRNAILAKAYGNTETLGRLVESTDTDMRNVVGSLIKSAGHVAKVRSQIKSGAIPEEVDITDNLLGAVEKLSQLRAQGQPLDSYLQQQDAFGDTLDDDSKQILQFIHDNLRSQKKLTDFIKTVYSQIADINQTTDDIFGDNTVPSKKDLIGNAKQREQQADQQGTFGEKPTRPVEQESKTEAGNAGSDKEDGKASGVKKDVYVTLKLEDSKGNEVEWKGSKDKHPGRMLASDALTEIDNRDKLLRNLLGCLG